MVDAAAEVTLPVPPADVFAALSDLEHATWLPGVREIHKLPGAVGLGAQYRVLVSIVGKQFDGILECSEFSPPDLMAFVLKDSLNLTITARVAPVAGGSSMVLTAAYAVPGPFGGAVEKTTIGAAKREVARAIEQFSAQFGRKAELPEQR
ncbi:MAG: SRPBCC family protein [Candidatus Dormibacteria bacterium]